MLEEFMKHKLLIDISGATVNELKELDRIINMPYLSGERIYEEYINANKTMYLHHRIGRVGLSFSKTPNDLYDNNKPMPYVHYSELLHEIKISPEEIESLFV